MTFRKLLVLFGVVDNIQDAEALQKADLNEFGRWTFDWQMAFNEDKCIILKLTNFKKKLRPDQTSFEDARARGIV